MRYENRLESFEKEAEVAEFKTLSWWSMWEGELKDTKRTSARTPDISADTKLF